MTTPDRQQPANLKELFSFRLNVLAHLSSKIAALVNEHEFGLDSREWRIIGLLGAFSPFSLQTLAREVTVDKSQASRMTGVAFSYRSRRRARRSTARFFRKR